MNLEAGQEFPEGCRALPRFMQLRAGNCGVWIIDTSLGWSNLYGSARVAQAAVIDMLHPLLRGRAAGSA